ncbi:MAG: arsenate reductase ArsC [Janthinobacterium lividum]
MSAKIYKVLFLCAGNSSRSIMAEALLNVIGRGRFQAFSAGCPPCREIHPYVIEQVISIGYPSASLISQSWEEFAATAAPEMDFVINVCDQAIPKDAPIWHGQPCETHWPFRNLDDLLGSQQQIRQVFRTVFKQIEVRINLLNSLPLESLCRSEVEREIYLISRTPLYSTYE